MKILSLLLIFVFYFSASISKEIDEIFFIGKMQSYNKKFTLYFKTREKAILARGQHSNYIVDYPQDLYFYDHFSGKEYPIISYDWFPKKAKNFYRSYKYPVFPEDFAYYLLNDNNTLILVSAFKDYYQNLIYDINKKELGIQKNRGKLNFIISTYAQNCGYKSLKNNFECKIYKPLISKNLINSIE
ncbi:MAG: hypothetical protein CMI55_04835 [Parcubacteria group bacterium]|jgi:hypothetical protein|nr:hypothetical protein [Parcubacteria group bacterium]|tara:strand:+ start:3746 stop:4303 length:558 start_codon:yes stop_codon:yes gene_type:complete